MRVRVATEEGKTKVAATCASSRFDRRNDRGAGRCGGLCGVEMAVTADYDAQSAVERELVL
jgi:hypothetical protein